MIREPFIGLEPYSEEYAPYFFGRETETRIVSQNLRSSRLTLLYGESGVGKSSLLIAGVAHHLKRQSSRELAKLGRARFAVVVMRNWRTDPIAARA